MNTPKLKLTLSHVFIACCKEGEMLPSWYYGLSYHDHCRNYDVFHIMPLNYIIRVCRDIAYAWNRFRSKQTWSDKMIERECHVFITKVKERVLATYSIDLTKLWVFYDEFIPTKK